MEGIELTDQNLFSEDSIHEAKNKVRSILHAEGDVTLQDRQNRLEGSTTLNSYEIDFYPQDEGTRIHVKYGLSTVGLVLGLIFLIIGVVIGAIILLLWYMKMDSVKDALNRAFPGYNVPPQQGYAQQPQQQPPPPTQQSQQPPQPQQPEQSSERDSETTPPPPQN
ncbi:MAG: hypothetical protein ACOC55_05940 [Candidatus Natronoplasma sp.]